MTRRFLFVIGVVGGIPPTGVELDERRLMANRDRWKSVDLSCYSLMGITASPQKSLIIMGNCLVTVSQ